MKRHTLPAGLIAAKTIDGYVYLDISKIIRIEADYKHTLIYCLGEPKAIRSMSPLSAFEARLLPDELFFKCHRSQIINLYHLKKFVRFDRIITLNDNHAVIIAEDRIHEFLLRTDPKQIRKI